MCELGGYTPGAGGAVNFSLGGVKLTTLPPKLPSVKNKMSTEWNDIVKNVAVLNGEGDRCQAYKDLCAGSLLVHLWSVAERGIAPSEDDIKRLRELIKKYEPEAYETAVAKCCGLYQTCDKCKKFQPR